MPLISLEVGFHMIPRISETDIGPESAVDILGEVHRLAGPLSNMVLGIT
jgi:hypothetical protein